MRMKTLLWAILPFLLLSACKKDELDLDKFSKTIEIEREQALPLVQGSFSFEDIAGHGYDSLETNISGFDTIFLYLLDNIDFSDTLTLSDFGSNLDVEFIKLYHSFTNGFPIGLDIHVYLYDSVQGAIIDSIPLNKKPDTVFLEPSTPGSDGIVDQNSVMPQIDETDLSSDLAYKLFHQANQIILNAKIPTSGDYIKVINNNALKFKFGIDAKGKYRGQI